MEEKLLCHIIIQREFGAVSDKKIVKQIVSAYKWDNEKGPVICFCNQNVYEYLVRNELDQKLYVDIIVAEDDFDEDKAKELIGEGLDIEFSYPFLPPFASSEQMDFDIDGLPETYAELCRATMANELYLSSI